MSSSLDLWPPGFLFPEAYATLWGRVEAAFRERLQAQGIPEVLTHELAGIYLPLAIWIHRQTGPECRVVGVNGGQGSGKSTLCDFLALVLELGFGHRVAGFSIDDLYKTREERERLAREVHPLLRTRGVPGTHDTTLGLATLRGLRTARLDTVTALPAFDKARDDRRPKAEWVLFRGRPDVILFEGWCVGTTPQATEALVVPVNDLERDEDPNGTWRRYVNAQLECHYAQLFAELDRLLLLEVPGMEQVFEWRSLQERKLAERTPSGERHRLMDAASLRHFIMHYERLTRHNLASLPERADLSLRLDGQHRFVQISVRRN